MVKGLTARADRAVVIALAVLVAPVPGIGRAAEVTYPHLGHLQHLRYTSDPLDWSAYLLALPVPALVLALAALLARARPRLAATLGLAAGAIALVAGHALYGSPVQHLRFLSKASLADTLAVLLMVELPSIALGAAALLGLRQLVLLRRPVSAGP